MPPNPHATEKVRRTILEKAGDLFRAHGYEKVGIDSIMAAAGLTRGAFYAHFKSKRALFAEIVGGPHGFNRKMQARVAGDRGGLSQEAGRIVADYLNPDHLDIVGRGCILAALTADVSRGDEQARQGYDARVRELAAEFARGFCDDRGGDMPDPRALAAIVLCAGGIAVARAMQDRRLATATLNACRTEVDRLLAEAGGS